MNANANHRIDTLDAEAESMVSRLTSDNFKIGPTSHTPLTPLSSNKWYYRDPQGEVQGKFCFIKFRILLKMVELFRSILDN